MANKRGDEAITYQELARGNLRRLRRGGCQLYGSRVDDSKHGGDLDLLWLVPENQEEQLNINKHKTLAALKGLMGEQKIDLSIISQHTLTTEIFYSHAMATAVKLK